MNMSHHDGTTVIMLTELQRGVFEVTQHELGIAVESLHRTTDLGTAIESYHAAIRTANAQYVA